MPITRIIYWRTKIRISKCRKNGGRFNNKFSTQKCTRKEPQTMDVPKTKCIGHECMHLYPHAHIGKRYAGLLKDAITIKLNKTYLDINYKPSHIERNIKWCMNIDGGWILFAFRSFSHWYESVSTVWKFIHTIKFGVEWINCAVRRYIPRLANRKTLSCGRNWGLIRNENNFNLKIVFLTIWNRWYLSKNVSINCAFN